MSVNNTEQCLHAFVRLVSQWRALLTPACAAKRERFHVLFQTAALRGGRRVDVGGDLCQDPL